MNKTSIRSAHGLYISLLNSVLMEELNADYHHLIKEDKTPI